jgi:S1-C subfamily serine protease
VFDDPSFVLRESTTKKRRARRGFALSSFPSFLRGGFSFFQGVVRDDLKLKIPTGALIQQVQPGTPAAEAGLQRGDVIHRIDRATVTSAADLTNALKSRKGDAEVVLQIERGGQLSFVTVTLK